MSRARVIIGNVTLVPSRFKTFGVLPVFCRLAYRGPGLNSRMITPLKPWTTMPAPVAIPAAYDNPCPNYSAAMLPTADGKYVIEIASDFDDQHKCTVYEGILPLPHK